MNNCPNEKPIKIMCEDGLMVIRTGDNIIEVRQKLSRREVEEFLNAVFGTTEHGIIHTENVKEEE